MSSSISKLLQVATTALIIAALLKELEKPAPERVWHGRVAGYVPYDFRQPDLESILNTYWNASDSRVIMPAVFGVGWAINFRTLLDNVGILKSDVTEEHYLMPTPSIKEVLIPEAEAEGEKEGD